MSEIEITYLQQNKVFRPMIPIWITKNNVSSGLFHALVDSGADNSLFPASIGKLAGIDIPKGKKIKVLGIGFYEMVAYQHEFYLYIGRHKIKTVADFSYKQDVPLLGREGFFDKFEKVIFKEKSKKIILKI